MIKAQVLREQKRLKAVRRRNEIVKKHNFTTKTLPKVPLVRHDMPESVKEAIHKIMAICRIRKIERERAIK